MNGKKDGMTQAFKAAELCLKTQETAARIGEVHGG